ncbi:SGNH/GDSL hydrolase family protein [Pseudorhodoferax soli]|uniref:Phospholipase/lecithinase/hemolysin n=1 Tax=Pseudorhodoferax soli TaxID=545864 RepID=A0A368XNP1_9BURK|nr:SGNH/GDSL hydrolase family protein [Pseudorhodoferax soli]RCW68137.1 phospholipase/lecithinase/hemolysin [Pseudorhodoferax soli]
MKSCVKSLCRSLLVVVGIGAAQLSWAGRSNYQELYVFGDSLSDTGNSLVATTAQQMVPALPPSRSPNATYWQGRYTNGPVAAEYLWDLMNRKNGSELTPSLVLDGRVKKAGVSFAFGGSTSGVSSQSPLGFTVPGLLGQIQMFNALLAGKKAPANALYVVWSGSNDYLQGVTSTPATVVNNVAASVRQLYAMGARSFLVPNLADLGLTPFVQVQNAGPAFTQLSQAHNALLQEALGRLSNELPAARIVAVDVFALGAAVVGAGQVSAELPALEYLAPGSGAADCLFRNPATCIDVNFSAFLPPFLFWDVMHPTTQVHGLIGSAMYRALQQKP